MKRIGVSASVYIILLDARISMGPSARVLADVGSVAHLGHAHTLGA